MFAGWVVIHLLPQKQAYPQKFSDELSAILDHETGKISSFSRFFPNQLKIPQKYHGDEDYLEPCQTSMRKIYVKIAFSQKSFIIDV